MSKNNENKLVQTLRFPEFKDDGEWEEKNISQIGYILNGLIGKKSDDFGSGKPYVQYKQVFEKSYIDFSECGKVNIGDNENQNQLHKGDILFTASSETPNEVGFASVLLEEPNEPTYLNSFCFALSPFNLNDINPNFSQYLFRSPFFRKQINRIAQGAIRYNLSRSVFLNLKLLIPSPQEQQKIAACLSSLDELITAESQKLELLKDHKKGLMQNLFTQEGEKVPKLRFPEFKDDGEWDYVNAGELFESIVNKNHNSDLPILAITQKQGAVPRDMINYHVSVTEKSIESYKVIEAGDFIISLMSFQSGIEYSNYKGLCSPAYIVLRKKVELENHFYRYYFKSFPFIRELNKNVQGIRIGKMISYEQFSEIRIPFPSLAEQQKIAACLSSLDELIKAQAEKIEQLKLHKKGLMQRLFPKIEE